MRFLQLSRQLIENSNLLRNANILNCESYLCKKNTEKKKSRGIFICTLKYLFVVIIKSY